MKIGSFALKTGLVGRFTGIGYNAGFTTRNPEAKGPKMATVNGAPKKTCPTGANR